MTEFMPKAIELNHRGEVEHPVMADIYREEVDILRKLLRVKDEEIRRLKLRLRKKANHVHLARSRSSVQKPLAGVRSAASHI